MEACAARGVRVPVSVLRAGEVRVGGGVLAWEDVSTDDRRSDGHRWHIVRVNVRCTLRGRRKFRQARGF